MVGIIILNKKSYMDQNNDRSKNRESGPDEDKAQSMSDKNQTDAADMDLNETEEEETI
jgi:hypothetical protein